jgi:hypothetical protein
LNPIGAFGDENAVVPFFGCEWRKQAKGMYKKCELMAQPLRGNRLYSSGNTGFARGFNVVVG